MKSSKVTKRLKREAAPILIALAWLAGALAAQVWLGAGAGALVAGGAVLWLRLRKAFGA